MFVFLILADVPARNKGGNRAVSLPAKFSKTCLVVKYKLH